MNSQDRCPIVHDAKVGLLHDSKKRKTLKDSRDFPIFQRKIPTGLLFPTESSNFAAMMRRLLLICWTCMAVAAATAQNTAFTADTLSDEVFTRMAGRSFPEGCTIDRHELRYLRVLHIDYEGQVHQGELVCNRRIANDLLDIFRKLYEAHYPIERIRLIDDYDADDERSMSNNNTSCFCYRSITGSQHLSKHALGMAVDINTLYNPYVKKRKDGTTVVKPAAGRPYVNRQKQFRYKIEKGDLCYRLFIEHGFRWGGNWHSLKDYQHFEKD